ncbi:MAG: class D sortase [Bryobacteraceae bacterium]|jgi:sortase A
MTVRLIRGETRVLLAAEWILLLVGLAALDFFVWSNTSSVLYQAYQDWAFDQSLRGLTPSAGGFLDAEMRWLWTGRSESASQAESSPTSLPVPSEPLSEAPAMRSVIGRLEIPRLNLSVMVREGADEGTLSRAVGHIPGTALPGKIGNVGLAGHRDTFFRALRNIREDDAIEFETVHGAYRYVVTSTKIVTPRDVSVLAASGGENLTLVTCYPFYYVGSAPKRFIVRAAQVATIPLRQQRPGS